MVGKQNLIYQFQKEFICIGTIRSLERSLIEIELINKDLAVRIERLCVEASKKQTKILEQDEYDEKANPSTPFVDLDYIRWSDEFQPGNKKTKTNIFPSQDQIQELKMGDRKVLETLHLSVIEFGHLIEFNFELNNKMSSNIKTSDQLEK